MPNSAGSLVAATLESVGYEYQSIILDRLTNPLTNEIGGLVYLFGIALAVLMTATQGKYKMGAWLLIGPPIFFATILPRTEIGNATWRFGRQDRNQEIVEREKREVLEDHTERLVRGQPRVSTLFSTFVGVISATQQEMVHIITRNRNEADLALVARAELYSQLHSDSFRDPGLVNLFHRAMLNECGDALDYARARQDPLFRPREFSNYRRDKIDNTPESTDARNLIESRNEDFETFYRELATIKDKNLSAQAAELIAASEVGRGGADFTNRVAAIRHRHYSCEEIWRFVLRFINIQSEETLERVLSRAAYAGISEENMLKLAQQAMVGAPSTDSISATAEGNNFEQFDLLRIRNVMSKFLLRNELRRESTAARMSYWVTGIQTQDVRMRFAGRESLTERARTSVQEWQEKSRFINAAAGVPYAQGVMLYILGSFFPFFALLLLIPGKHGGFILWFMLWIWVKSWDVMMALVTILSDVIFSMLTIQNQENKQGLLDEGQELENMELALVSLNELDPTFQLSNYYTIIATAMLAIPPTTAYIILGSLKGGASIISQGVNRNAVQASGHFLGYAEQKAVSQLTNDFNTQKEQQIAQYNKNHSRDKSVDSGVKDERGNLLPTGKNNPVKNFPNTSTVPGVKLFKNIDSRPGTSAGSSMSLAGNGTDYDRARKGVNTDAERGGTAQGYTLNSGKGRHVGHSKTVMLDAALKAQFSRDKTQGKIYGVKYAELESQSVAISAQAAWDSVADPLQMYRVNLRSVMGAITIPSPNFELNFAGAEEEKKALLKRFDLEQSRKIADWEFKGEVASAFVDVTKNILKSAHDPKLLEQEYQSSGALMSKQQKNALRGDAIRLKKQGKDIANLSTNDVRNLDENSLSYIKNLYAINNHGLNAGAVGAASIEASKNKYTPKWLSEKYKEIFGTTYGDPNAVSEIDPHTIRSGRESNILRGVNLNEDHE